MTHYIPASKYSNDTPLTISKSVKLDGGLSYPLLSSGKNLCVVFPNSEVKPLLIGKGDQARPTLVVSQSDLIMTTLASIRSRLMVEQGISDDKMKPLLVETVSKDSGYSLIKKRSAPRKIQTLFINPTKTAVLRVASKDLQGEEYNYADVVGHTCHLHLYVHIQSLFQNDDGMWNLIFKASQMTLLPEPVVEAVEPVVEAVEPGEASQGVEECNDPSLLL